MVQKKLPLINSAHGSETRNIINELIKLFNSMGYTYNESLQKAQDILDEAQQTNDMNENVQQQIDSLILANGESDAEVIQARGGLPLLKDRLDESDAQLAQKADKTYVDDEFEGFNTQLAQTVTKKEVENHKNIFLSYDYPPVDGGQDGDIWIKIKQEIPQTIDGLEFWLDTSTLNGLYDGDSVDSWMDKVEFTPLSQADKTNMPIYKKDVIKGNAVVRFNGSQYLINPDLDIELQTVIIVGTYDSFPGILFGGSNGVSDDYIGASSGAPSNFTWRYRDQVLSGDVSEITTKEPHIFTADISQSIYIDGEVLATEEFRSSYNFSEITLGTRRKLDNFLNGDIAEVIIYNRVLTNSELDTLHDYLSRKYGITLESQV